MKQRKREIKLNKIILIGMLGLLIIQGLIVGGVGSFGISMIQKQEEESLDYILKTYQRNLNNALNRIDMDLQDILSSQSTLSMLENQSDLQRWHASFSLVNLLNDKRISTEDVDAYIISNQGYKGFLVSRSENIKYDDLKHMDYYFEEELDMNVKNSGWTSAQIHDKGYLMKYYVYGGVSIAALLSEDRVQQILSYGQDANKLVEFYVTGSDRKIICSSNPGWRYGEEVQGTNGTLKKYTQRKQEVMEGAYYIIGNVEKIGIFGQSPYFVMILVMLFISIILLFMMLKFMNSEVVGPVKILSQTSEKIRLGDLSVRPEYECQNSEMLELKNMYGTMLDTIVDLKLKEYEKVIQLKDSELKYMHMQLKPHFFLNALSTINSMAYQNKNEEIHEFIQVFSENIRYMFKVGLYTVSLEEEIEHVEKYLNMQRFLYKDNFYAYFEVPDELKQWKIPQMILHTFIENIFKHVMDINSFVSIFMLCSTEKYHGQTMLKIQIHNTGKHFEEKVIRRINEGEEDEEEQNKGIGLVHTKGILSILYDDQNLMKLENEEPEGTQITIWIPEETRIELL